ncbi:MAG TPA: M24 family metallopeptidase [Mycobacteriales bacterium]|jgi:hypothetical protein|nr:M24 family metallopeptidase [Mycobacteriales bacterium]
MPELLARIRAMRRSAAEALASVLHDTRNQDPNEVELRDAWHARLAADPTTCAEGWYMPPPHGIVLALDTSPRFERLQTPTFRPESTWPSTQRHLADGSLLSVYCSRVHRATGAIGDIGCSLYRGTDPALRNHLHNIWRATSRIAEEVRLGIAFRQLYGRAMEILREHNLVNDIYSTHDGSQTNIGHTVPWSYETIRRNERLVLAGGSPQQVADLVSGRRRFISPTETLEITQDMVLTIEPRPRRPGLPPAWFHLVVGFERGRRIIVTEFEPLFETYDMQYLGA